MLRARSIASVLLDVIQNVQDIVSSEFRLAKSEIGNELEKAKLAAVVLGIGASFGILGVAFVLLGLLFALSRVVPNWAAAFIVAGIIGIASVLILHSGRRMFKRVRPIPERVVERLREDVQWAKQHNN
jgi:hypothetical protein